MKYTNVWKLNQDKTIVEECIHQHRYVEVEARLHRGMIPRWITDHPLPEDFDIWAESIPRRESYSFALEFEELDDQPIIEMLEREGVVGTGTCQRRPGGYGEKRTHSGAISENADCHDKRKQNQARSWRFPQSSECRDVAWYASQLVARALKAQRKRHF